MELSTTDTDGIEALQEEALRRVRTRVPIRVVEPAEAPIGLTFPGTVTIFAATEGSDVLDQVEAAVAEPTLRQPLVERILGPSRGRTRMTIAEASQTILALPTFAEVRYANRTLMHNIAVPDPFEASVTSLPYNGGPLRLDALELVQYHTGDGQDLKAVAVVHRPELTRIEQQAIDSLTDDESGDNLAPGLMCYAACAVAGAVLMTVAATLCSMDTMAAATNELDTTTGRLSDDQLASLDDEPSANELLAIRQQLLQAAIDAHS